MRYKGDPAFITEKADEERKSAEEFASSFDGEDTEVTRQPYQSGRTGSRRKRWLALGGIAGLFWIGDALNAGSMIGSGCSSVAKGVKGAAVSVVYTTPAELVEEVRETLQDYKEEIGHGSYQKELGELQGELDQFQSDSVKAAELRRMLLQPELEGLLSKVYPGNPKELDRYLNSLMKVLDKYQSREERKQDTLSALDNLKDTFTAREKSELVTRIYGSKPEERYRRAISDLAEQNKAYAAFQELVKYLTPPQKTSLAAMLSKPAIPATAAPPAKASPAPAAKTIMVPAAKAAVPAKAPILKARDSYDIDLAQQKAREMARNGGGR